MKTTIDVISDIICPWCYVGKRRLEKAIAVAAHVGVHVRWRPFQLNTDMPKAGVNRKEYRTAKFGSWERSRALDAQVTEAGRAEGIPFAFGKIDRTPNTLDAHRLIRLAEQDGIQDAIVEAIFRGYFTEGHDITNVPTLLNVVSDAGLDRRRSEILLSGDDGVAAIRAAEEQARRSGVRGVPFYVINGTLALSGAREPSDFLAAFEHAAALPGDEGSVCTVGPEGKSSC
jgi:predicted DsbA family dithiol-disulfide isomerase